MSLEQRGVNYKEITSDVTVTTAGKAGLLYGLTLLSGTADSKILIEDGGSGGTAVWALSLNGTTAAGETSESIAFAVPIVCETDIYANITGTAAIAYVAYKEIE
jgi:hypothetical protein